MSCTPKKIINTTEKKTTNTLSCFETADLRNDQKFVQQRTQNYGRDRSKRAICQPLKGKRRLGRVRNNDDTTGFCLDFDRQMNSFTNSSANEANRRREVEQEFEYCKTNFIKDYETSEIKAGNKEAKNIACVCDPIVTGGIGVEGCASPRCYNWNNCNNN